MSVNIYDIMQGGITSLYHEQKKPNSFQQTILLEYVDLFSSMNLNKHILCFSLSFFSYTELN